MHAKAFFLFTASCSSHLYIYFSQRVLCCELPKDLFTQWLTDFCLSRFIVPYRLWWNKNLQLGLSKIHYVTDSKGSVCHLGCVKWNQLWMRTERACHHFHLYPVIDLMLQHTHSVMTETLFETKKIAACVRQKLNISPCREWMLGKKNASPLSLLCQLY